MDIFDGTFSNTSLAGPQRWHDSPSPRSNQRCTFDQDYLIDQTLYTPLAIGTLYSGTFMNGATSWMGAVPFYLVKESEPRPEGPLVKVTRTWSAVPSAYSDFERYVYQFVGFSGPLVPNGIEPNGREPTTRNVVSRISHSFYAIDGTTYTDPSQLPLKKTQEFTYDIAGYTNVRDLYLSDKPPFNYDTIPRQSLYNTWVDNAKTYGWACDPVANVSPTHPGQMVAEDSTLALWMGNIWRVTTRYVLAQ